MVSRSLAVLAALVSISGLCGAQTNRTGTSGAANAPVPTVNEAPKVPASVSADTTGLPIDPKTYLIGPEDILRITVWREPDFSGPKGVRPDGKITMSLIGDLQAAGLTPDALSAQLKKSLSEYLKTPDITVEVIQVNSKRFTVSGQVNRPGPYPLVTTVRVFDALNIAGGFRDFADEKHIVIISTDGKRTNFNFHDFVKGKNTDANIELKNGDTVYVK